jgi:predicted dehydrogenase
MSSLWLGALCREVDVIGRWGLFGAYHIKAALEKGKHVICEKPFTSTYDELATLYNLTKTNKCMIFKAITTFHLPNLKKIKYSLTRIGKIKLVTNNFVQLSYPPHDPTGRFSFNVRSSREAVS